MSTTRKLRFNMRAVPRSERSDETLSEMVEYYTENLQNKDWKWALCVHEAAHAIQSERFGYSKPKFDAPLAFTYDRHTKMFAFHQAQVWTDIEDNWRENVRVSLAGPVVERALTPKSSWGTKVSYAGDFAEANEALALGCVPRARRAKFIKRVEREIRSDLRKPAFRAAVLRRAKTYERILNRRIAKLKAA